ncbi:MAG: TIGR02206 family membrane protein [Clostridia bacterium]|nr:TIGR02206 family membrane protein [Clostridia bacterium]
MKDYFGAYPVEGFEMLSTSHVVVLFIIAAIIWGLYYFRIHFQESPYKNSIRIILAVLLILLEVILQIWYITNGIWSLQYSLPLHLCSMAILLGPVMLITRKYYLYEVLFFWGIGGTTQAILTPDLWYGFPHFIFFQYFIAHSLIVFSCLWMTFVEGFRPTLKSVVRAFLFTNLYAAFVLVVNILIGSNYLYLLHKPDKPTILDFLQPWPWYLVQLEIIALIVCFLCYLPFMIADKRNKSSSNSF